MTTRKPKVVAYATHHDEPLLFPSKTEAAMYCDAGEEPLALIHISDYEALATECEKLRKDAERYRWLRSVPSGPEAQRIVNNTPEGMDAAIDSARAGGDA